MPRLRRALIVVSLLGAAWAVVISLTGGFIVRLEWIRVSSRTPINAAVIAVVAAIGAAALALPNWRLSLREDRAWCRAVAIAAGPVLRDRWARLSRVGIVQALALVAIVLIVHQWTIARPFFLDEEMMALNIRDRSVAGLAGPLWLAQSAPYGWLVLERATLLTFGTGEQALRLVPALFGIAAICAAFFVSHRWLTPVAGAILVLLLGIGQWLSFYSVVLKPYSADVFWAFLLPALGAWAIEASGDGSGIGRRTALWWLLSAIGQWFANGALFVTPGCALVMLFMVRRRHGWQAARRFALLGFAWLPFFGLHYLVALRHSLHSPYLQGFWSFAMPPAVAGFDGTLAWLAAQLQPLADNPGGTTVWISFWICAAAGFAVNIRSPLAMLFATVPLSAFVLAAVRLVPLYQRLSLWTVPAMYVGIALLAHYVAKTARDAIADRRWIQFGAAVVIASVMVHLCVDIFRRGRSDIRYGRPADSNQQLDDRSAVRWLTRHAGSNDAIVTTHLALPAVWWYGGVPIADRDVARRQRADENRVLEVEYRLVGQGCERDQLRDGLRGRKRALVYFGFRFGVPDEFDDVLLRSLAELGTVSAYSEFAEKSRAAVVDLHPVDAAATPPRAAAAGCIAVHPERRW